MSKQENLGTAVITGASSGIGAVYADRLARRGHNVVLVARNEARLEKVAQKITQATGRRAEVLVADLQTNEGVTAVARRIAAGDVDTLINNAGFGLSSPLLDTDPAQVDAMIQINVTALARLSYAAAQAFVARGNGAIVNISSIAAVTHEVLNGSYSGTKAFVFNFSRSLHNELKEKGVRVQVVLPGATETEFWDVAGVPIGQLPPEWLMSSADLVDAALSGLDAGEVVTIPSLPEIADWQSFDAARQVMLPNLSRRKPAARYGVQA